MLDDFSNKKTLVNLNGGKVSETERLTETLDRVGWDFASFLTEEEADRVKRSMG